MEFIGALILFFLMLIITVAITRWVFRIDYTIKILEQTANNLEEMKKQNTTLIQQQDEIIELLERESNNRD
jgi:hypothetical protein